MLWNSTLLLSLPLPPPALPPFLQDSLAQQWKAQGPGSTMQGCVNELFSFSKFSASSSVKWDENGTYFGVVGQIK